jgi:hypothetical protein
MRAMLLIALTACGGSSAASDATTSSDGPPSDGSTVVDPCPAPPPACPTPPAGFARGDGLRAIDRCAFPMTDVATWDDRGAIIDAFPATAAKVTVADAAADTNRIATKTADPPGNPPGVIQAFGWQAGDEGVTYWIPQGLTGSFDAHDDGLVAGRKLLLVSWYYERANEPSSPAEKGVRIAIVDVTNPNVVSYRFALLAEPIIKDGRSDLAPVVIHAGGLAWIGDYLYVPVTSSGFRVFDLSRILRVAGTADRLGYDAATGEYDAHGYKYVIPQVGEYVTDQCDPVFSYVALDRTTTPHSLVSGEYSATSVAGRIYRWPLDETNRLQLTDQERVIADGAWFAGESHVQGGLARDATFFLSSSYPAAGAGALYRVKQDAPSTTLGWIDSPEDVAYDPQLDAVWSQSEAVDARHVIAVDRAAIDP